MKIVLDMRAGTHYAVFMTDETRTKQTIGAISGAFLSHQQKDLNDAVAATSLSALIAADADAAMLMTPPAYIGVCPVCDSPRYGDSASPCGQCENYWAQGLLVGNEWKD